MKLPSVLALVLGLVSISTLAEASPPPAKVAGSCLVQTQSSDPRGWKILAQVPFSVGASQSQKIFEENGLTYEVGLATSMGKTGNNYNLVDVAIRRSGTQPPDGLVAIGEFSLKTPQPASFVGSYPGLSAYSAGTLVVVCGITSFE